MRKLAFIAIATLALAACSSPAPVEKAPEPAKVEAPAATPEETAKKEAEIAAFKKKLEGAKTSLEARNMGKGQPVHLASLALDRAAELIVGENERRKKLEDKK